MQSSAADSISKDLTQAFSALDANGGGYVDKADLTKVLAVLDPERWDSCSVDALLDGAGMQRSQCRVEYAKVLAWILQDTMPIKQRSAAERTIFLHSHWAPYLEKVRCHVEASRRRQSRGFSAHEVLPTHAEISSLANECMLLTQRWHGRANVSAFYELFMEMAEMDGHTQYRFSDIPQERSPDGYTRVLNMQVRRRLYQPPTVAAASTSKVGILDQATGESAIDNLLLPNIMRRQHALFLKVGSRVQQFLVQFVRRKQRKILATVGLSVDSDEATIMQRMQELKQADVGVQSISLNFLIQQGHLLESYGQLCIEARDQISNFLCYVLGGGLAAELPARDSEGELDAFVAHCHKHPGRAFKGSVVEHKSLLFRAIASPDIRVLWRSEVERFTQHRYFSVAWTRKVPLARLSAPGTKESSEKIEVLRPAGSKEFTRFRKNVFAYGDSHGLGQSGGGWAEDWPVGSLMHEFGALLCADESAKVPNHCITDIEKIIMDCVVLCPAGGVHDALPGEVLHDAGQNPVIASSIGLTQHTQTTRAGAEDFPLIGETQCPQWVRSVGGWIDLVQVGEHADAFFISARSSEPDSKAFLQFLVDLRLHFLSKFEGSIDFNVTCHATKDGEYIVVFSPVACIRKIKVPKGEGVLGLDFNFENPELGEVVTNHRLAAACVDCSHGKGNILAQSENYWNIALDGKPMLMRLYDFNRKVGTRDIAQRFIDELLLL